MKIFKFLAVALVAMLGFTACDKDCDHDFIEYDNTKNLVGTWTCLEEDQSEAMVINPDGSFNVTGIMQGGYMYESKGTIKVVNNKVSLVFEGDEDVTEGRLELVAGKSLSIVINEEYDIRLTYDYCDNDLADEVVGMWVCNEGVSGAEKDMGIITYSEDGKAMFTGNNVTENNDNLSGLESTYKVVGNILFQTISYPSNSGVDSYMAIKLTYAPNSTSLGDVMTQATYLPKADGVQKSTSSWLRIKQYLELPGMKYDYIKTFVTNVKGEDKDIPFLNTSFNFAKMDGSIIDKFLKSILFTVEFPEAKTIKYSYLLEGQNVVIEAPIEVEGNKMTIKMSENNPVYQDVDMYAFQDQDNTQMHWYMPTTSFEKFFGNTSVALMLGYGQLDKDDTEGIANVYKTIADAVESINLSLVMTQSK